MAAVGVLWTRTAIGGFQLALCDLQRRYRSRGTSAHRGQVDADGRQTVSWKITDFLAKYELTMPTFITVAEEHAPGSIDRIAFRAYYADLQAKSPELREDLAYASAALPFGILPDMQILDRTFVDGGVADNTPFLPLLINGMINNIDELWLILLSPSSPTLDKHARNVVRQGVFADGIPPGDRDGIKIDLTTLSNLKVVTFTPRVSLGNVLTGTLNFNRKRTKALIAHGEYVATGTLRSELGPSSPVDPLPYRRMTRLRPLFRALPRCSLFSPFRRGNASELLANDFNFPRPIRQSPDQAAGAAWLASVVFLWALYLADLPKGDWGRAVWATLIALFMLSVPTWWARLRRNFGWR